MRTTLLIIAVAGILSVLATDCASIEKIVNFGDSTSDTGNGAFVVSNGVIPSTAYWNGRFSNGPTYIEIAAGLLNVSLSSYAVGGATTDNAKIQGYLGNSSSTTAPHFKVASVTDQVASYLIEGDESVDPSRILYTMWIGNNDGTFNDMYNLNVTGADAADSLYDVWSTLADSGAQRIVAFVPPLGTPFLTDYGVQMHKLAQQFNTERSPDANVGLFETPGVLTNVLALPQLYGFAHAFTDPCCTNNCYSGMPPKGTAQVCPKPDTFISYDEFFHPTAAFHKVIGASLVDFVNKWFS
ncbi:Aste57867_23913 [Aphanomyces stellatus]|uniref:Aste57867_23913 protein n=1 Tax=Aphanomyces stellatus TaxID=120398 RepID=A0A485LPA2_9STRA|nr:hypothetical protein As57867_023840 [Aphanomyces stellatus]VFU00556.1 Aste57867_23913 [Aphanomyces stellatus]